MVFSSISFLFYFLPCVLIAYFIAPRRLRNAILAVASLLFYAWGEPRYILIMLFSTVADYTCGRLIAREQNKGKKGKVYLIASIVINLSVLGFFKYFNFLAGNVMSLFGGDATGLLNVTLPIGISFYTFQTMSYTIDVYRKNVPAQKNIINFATFVTLFPQLIAGPIVKYTDIAEELDDVNRGSVDMFSEGVARFIAGLGKKVLFANNIGLLWDAISSTSIGEMSVVYAWLGIIAYAFQIYFDFSGYSDMAIGLGKIFGFDFPENFNYPYISKSVSEFWRRWHMTLGSFFRDYVYIPLGGNRHNVFRNLFIVWFLTGFWHGASWNFIIWGLYNGLFICLERIFKSQFEKIPSVIKHIYLLTVVNIGFVFFKFESLAVAGKYISYMFGAGASFTSFDLNTELINNIFWIALAVILCMPVMKYFERLYTGLSRINVPLSIAANTARLALIAVLIVFSTAHLAGNSFNPFLYNAF